MKKIPFGVKILTVCFFLITPWSVTFADDLRSARVDSDMRPVKIDNLRTSLIDPDRFFPWPHDMPPAERFFPSLADVNYIATANRKLRFNFVALGDSYGAGQGAPNNATRNHDLHLGIPWLEISEPDDSRKKPTWENRQCRRSINSPFNRAITSLGHVEYGNSTLDNLLDIGFENYACSGAVTNDFFETRTNLGDMYDLYPPKTPIRPQLEEFKSDWSDSSVDALAMSIGGNDIGFGSAIMTAVLGDVSCTDITLDNLLECSVDSHGINLGTMDNQWLKDRCKDVQVVSSAMKASILSVFGVVAPDIHLAEPLCLAALEGVYQVIKQDFLNARDTWRHDLMSQYERINAELRSSEYDFIRQNEDGNKNIFIMEYPDALHGSDGEYCSRNDLTDDWYNPFVGDKFFESFKDREIEWLGEHIYKPLITTINDAAEHENWTVVPVASGSMRHGMCTDDRYVNLNIDALKRQGADVVPPVSISGGMIHPSVLGYEFMGDALAEKLKPLAIKKLRVGMDEAPTRLAADFVRSVTTGVTSVKIHWDDQCEKEEKYTLRIVGRGSDDPKLFTVGPDTNEYEFTLTDLLSYFPSGFAKINLVLTAPGDIFSFLSQPIYIALQKPRTPTFTYIHQIMADFSQSDRPGGVMLRYDNFTAKGLVQYVTWANVEDEVTLGDLEGMAVNWIPYEKNHIETIIKTKKTDKIVNVYYAWDETPGFFNIERSSKKIIANISVCNHFGCSVWGPALEAYRVKVWPSSGSLEEIVIPGPDVDIRVNPTNIRVAPTNTLNSIQ